MPVSPAEREYLLSQIGRFAETDLNNLWRQAEQLGTDEFFNYVRDGFVEVATTYHQTTGQLAATWFEESDPLSPYIARVAEPITPERLLKSAEWALGGDGPQGLSRMQSSMQRAVYDGARETVVINAEATRSRWVRVTRANACEFCRMLATRSGDYAYLSRESATSVGGRRREGGRKRGSKFHDDCYCTAVEVRDGQELEDVLDEEKLKLYEQWTDEYEKAVANAGSTDTAKVMAAWREETAKNPVVNVAASNAAATPPVVKSFMSERLKNQTVPDRWENLDSVPDWVNAFPGRAPNVQPEKLAHALRLPGTNHVMTSDVELTDKQLTSLMDDYAEAIKAIGDKFPEGVAMHIPRGSFLRNASGYTLGFPSTPDQPAHRVFYLRPSLAKNAGEAKRRETAEKYFAQRGKYWHMPAAKDGYRRYVMVHEMGHIFDNLNVHTGGRLASGLGAGGASFWKTVKSDLSEYGQSETVEGYAEAFAQYFLGGRDSSPVARKYARVYRW